MRAARAKDMVLWPVGGFIIIGSYFLTSNYVRSCERVTLILRIADNQSIIFH